MEKVCNFCGNKGFKYCLIQYVYRRGDQLLMINNVPCEQCDFCGEQYFEAVALKKIEEDFKNIYISGKKTRKQVTVPVEEFAEI